MGFKRISSNGIPTTKYDLAQDQDIVSKISTEIDGLIDAAPATMNTLNEIAAALNDDENAFTTLSNQITTGDSATLSSAQSYTDTQNASQTAAITAAYEAYADGATTDMATTAYVDGADATTLASAQSYADAADATTLSSAQAYTDNEIAAIVVNENYKILSQIDAESVKNIEGTDYNQAQIIYTVPSNTQTEISSISIINNTADGDYSLGVVKKADVASSINIFEQFKDVMFVAVAFRSETFAYSTDGITWTQSSTLPFEDWQSVTYGDGKFVAIAFSSDDTAYSTDGTTWTAAKMPSSKYWYSVTHGDGKFVAVAYGTNTAAYSTDGITWTASTLPSSGAWYSVTHGDGKFVAVAYGTNTAAYSTDGISWTATTMPVTRDWFSVTHGDDKFVAVAFSSRGAYSTDGITWTTMTMPSNQYWSSVTHGDGKFVAIVESSSTAAYSTDGITWTSTSMPSSVRWQSVTHGDGKFVAIAYETSTAAYSTDGIVWTASTMPASTRWRPITVKEDFPFTDTLSNTQTLVPTTTILSGEVQEIVGNVVLSEGDQLRIYSESPDIYVHVYGKEIV